MSSTSKKLNINEERVKKFLAEKGYDLNESISYGEFLDLLKILTGSSEIPFILAKSEKMIGPNNFLSFFDFLPLICRTVGCESNRSNPPKRIYMPLVEIIEKMIVYSKWCPYCIARDLEEREKENKKMAAIRFEEQDQDVEVDMDLKNLHDNVKLVKRGRSVEAIKANTPFIDTAEGEFFNDRSIKRTWHVVNDENQASENEFVAVSSVDNVQGEDVETIHNVLTEPTDAIKYRNPVNETMMYDDNVSFEDKIKEMKKRYAIKQLEEKTPTTDDNVEVIISDINTDEERESIITPTTKVVKRKR